MKTTLASVVALALVTLMACPVIGQVDPTPLVVGTQGDFFADDFFNTLADDLPWFTFQLEETTFVDIDINRTAAPPDFTAALYEGDVTKLSFGATVGDDLIFAPGDPTGQLTYIETQDDTEDDPFGGPFGDPRFQLTLGPGFYSVIFGTFGAPAGEFTITSNVGINPVPEPTACVVLALGSLALIRRKR